MNPLSLVVFALLWTGIVYTLDSLIIGHFKKISPKIALLYIATVAMIGVFGEIFLDSIYNYFVGNPLWRYNILPIHQAYTSAYAPVIWGILGLHIYLIHDTLRGWGVRKTRTLAFIFSLEALLLEALLTISSKYLLGEYMYYYYPGDLWHVTSIQNMPFYFICGVVVTLTVKRFKTSPRFFTVLCAFLVSVIVFFT